jgi:hypothetical protein
LYLLSTSVQMAEKNSLFETPFLDVKRKDLKPWLAHYRGQYCRLLQSWYGHRYFVTAQAGSYQPLFHALILALAAGYFHQRQKEKNDAIFWGSKTNWDYSH